MFTLPLTLFRMPGACDVVRWIVKDDKMSRFPSRLVFFTFSPSSHMTPVHVQFAVSEVLRSLGFRWKSTKTPPIPRVSRMDWKALESGTSGSVVRFKFRLHVGSHDLTMP